jgi:hypothetical protein
MWTGRARSGIRHAATPRPPRLKADVSQRGDIDAPTLQAAPCDNAPAFVTLQLEAKQVHDRIEQHGRARHLHLLLEDGQEGNELLSVAIGVHGDGLDELSERLSHDDRLAAVSSIQRRLQTDRSFGSGNSTLRWKITRFR